MGGWVGGGIPVVELKNTKCPFQFFFQEFAAIFKIFKN